MTVYDTGLGERGGKKRGRQELAHGSVSWPLRFVLLF